MSAPVRRRASLARGLELLVSGAVHVDPLISAVAPLAEGPLWFERLHAGTRGLVKVILTPPTGEARAWEPISST